MLNRSLPMPPTPTMCFASSVELSSLYTGFSENCLLHRQLSPSQGTPIIIKISEIQFLDGTLPSIQYLVTIYGLTENGHYHNFIDNKLINVIPGRGEVKINVQLTGRFNENPQCFFCFMFMFEINVENMPENTLLAAQFTQDLPNPPEEY